MSAIISKEQWKEADETTRRAFVVATLTDLFTIRKGSHPLYKTKEQGKLSSLRAELEQQVLNFAQWASEKEPDPAPVLNFTLNLHATKNRKHN